MNFGAIDLKKFHGLLFLLLLTIFSIFQSVINYSNPYLILFIFIAYLAIVFFYEKRFFISYGYIIFYIITNVAGVFLIETSQFHLSELNTQTSNNQSLLLIVIAHIVFIETIRLLYLSNDQTFEINSDSRVKLFQFEMSKARVLQLILIVIFFVFLVLFFMVIDKPFFKVKLDRFLYEEKYLTGFTNKVSNLSLYFSVFVGMYFLHNKDKKAIIVLLLMVFYLVWIGHKFSSLVVIAFVTVLPFIYSMSKQWMNRIIIGGIALVLLLLSLVTVQSFFVYNRDFSENSMYIKARLAQQGQLWWATYGNEEAKKTHVNDLEDELKTYFRLHVSEDVLYNSGIYKIMKLTTPEDIVHQKIYVKKSRYAYSTQASIFYYFNGLGLLIFSVISAVAYYFINKNLIGHIFNFNIIPALLYTRLFVVINRVLMQSDFDKIFSLEVILIIIVLVIYSQVKKRNLEWIKI